MEAGLRLREEFLHTRPAPIHPRCSDITASAFCINTVRTAVASEGHPRVVSTSSPLSAQGLHAHAPILATWRASPHGTPGLGAAQLRTTLMSSSVMDFFSSTTCPRRPNISCKQRDESQELVGRGRGRLARGGSRIPQEPGRSRQRLFWEQRHSQLLRPAPGTWVQEDRQGLGGGHIKRKQLDTEGPCGSPQLPG